MGGFSAQTQQPQTSGGKTGPVADAVQQVSEPAKPLDGVDASYAPRPMGKGGAQTNSATSGQPTMGAPNKYPNTVGQWDNTQQQTQQPMQGKGKGA
jgi:hypothetical protein